MNLTKEAIITDVSCHNGIVWIQLSYGKTFPTNHEFNTKVLSDFEKVQFLIKVTKASDIEGLRGKSVRVIDRGEEVRNSLIAIGSCTKNQYIDLYGGEFAVSEKKIYKSHKLKSS